MNAQGADGSVPPGESRGARRAADLELAQLRIVAEDARRRLADTLLAIDDRMATHLADGAQYPDDAGASILAEANAKLLLALLGCHEDVDQAARVADVAMRKANVDALTGLATRSVVVDRLALALAQARRREGRVGVLFVDLDRFKTVNDMLGHGVGDEVLRSAASALVGAVRATDTVGRYGGDEFVVLLDGIDEPADAARVAEKIVRDLRDIRVECRDARGVEASIGIALFPDDAPDARALVACADAAMFRAKRLATEARVARAGNGVAARRRRTAGAVGDDLASALLQESNARLLESALALQERCELAESALRSQADGIATVVHELRNPLMPIRTAAAMLLTADTVQHARMQGIIERQLGHLTKLVDDLMDVSRAGRSKFHIELRAINLADVLATVTELCEPAVSARRHALVVDTLESGLPMQGDATRLVQVFANLVLNACKYTPEGGTIRIHAQRRAGRLVVGISDTGIGIGADALAHIFDPFVQERHATRFNSEGLGIGLAVVRELVEAHGGSVSACSDGVGLGSRFEVVFPA